MTTDRRRGGYAKRRERREAILAAADQRFAKQGFRGASLAAIASQVGLSEAGVLHHFPSKEPAHRARLDADHPAHECTIERYRALRGRVTDHLRAERTAGRVDPGLGPAFVAPQLQWLLDPDEVDLTALFANFLKRLQAR